MEQASLILNTRRCRIRPVALSMTGSIDGNHAIVRRERLGNSEFKVLDASRVSMNHHNGWSFAKFDVSQPQSIDGDKVFFDDLRPADYVVALNDGNRLAIGSNAHEQKADD